MASAARAARGRRRQARRKGRELHNFAAFLMDIAEGKIRQMRMVEALPAYSDEFWKA